MKMSNKVNSKQSKNIMAKQNSDSKKVKFNKKGKQGNGKNQLEQNSNNKGVGKKNLNQKQNGGVKRQMEDSNKSTKKFMKTNTNKVKVNSSVEDAAETGILFKTCASMKTSFANSYLESLKRLQKQHNLNTCTYTMDNVYLKVLVFIFPEKPLNQNEIDKIKKYTNAYDICNISPKYTTSGTLTLKFSKVKDAGKVEQTGFITIRGRKFKVTYLPIKGNTENTNSEKTVAAKPKKMQQKVKAIEVDEEEDEEDGEEEDTDDDDDEEEEDTDDDDDEEEEETDDDDDNEADDNSDE